MGLEVANVGLHRGQAHRLLPCTLIEAAGLKGPHLNRVAQGRSRAMGLEVPHLPQHCPHSVPPPNSAPPRAWWCCSIASARAVATTMVCEGPLGAVMVELLPSWFIAVPRRAASDAVRMAMLSAVLSAVLSACLQPGSTSAAAVRLERTQRHRTSGAQTPQGKHRGTRSWPAPSPRP